MTIIILLILSTINGVFPFSEGKPCIQKTRPHTSRCDIYLKCVTVALGDSVWIIQKCEEGLIYERDLQMCVLPSDDWECKLDDTSNDYYDSIPNGLDVDAISVYNKRELSNDVHERNKSNEVEVVKLAKESSLNDAEIESSGDGIGPDYIILDTIASESKTSEDSSDPQNEPVKSAIDPKLMSHLQRLSQLIDGLKNTYQNKNSPSVDLRPDQLNAFLAHYNIKSQLNSLMELNEDKKKNRTIGPQPPHFPDTKLDPETKVVLSNYSPNNLKTSRLPDGYSNSQIVVNKPEGSVLFALGNPPKDSVEPHRDQLQFSEDTLKTVLQLSKQMIENQNFDRLLSHQSYFPSIVQPIYIPRPLTRYSDRIFNRQGIFTDGNDEYSSLQRKPDQVPTTIIHSNVIPLATPQENDLNVNSYGQKLTLYPPLTSFNLDDQISPKDPAINYINRYDNTNQIIEYPTRNRKDHINNRYKQQTTPSELSHHYFSNSGSTLPSYYTPSPHLDETNVNNVFQMETYPTVDLGSVPFHNKYANRNEPTSTKHPHSHDTYYTKVPLRDLFPARIEPNKVQIRPNSQPYESIAQDNTDDNNYSSEEVEEMDLTISKPAHTYKTQYSVKNNVVDRLTPNVVHQTDHDLRNYNSLSETLSPSSELPTSRPAFMNNDGAIQMISSAYPYLSNNFATNAYSDVDSTNCPPGVRQPNTNDCTKYYICSRDDHRVMPFSCPQYTAFNPQTRICEGKYYAMCHPDAILSRYTVSENRRIHLEAIKALQDAKRINQQVIKAQALAHQLQETNQNFFTTATPMSQQHLTQDLTSFFQNEINSKPTITSTKNTSHGSDERKPTTQTKKRKYYCKAGDKVADQTSIRNYFVCYKNSQGMMKGHRMTCSQGLIFCSASLMCTFASKC